MPSAVPAQRARRRPTVSVRTRIIVVITLLSALGMLAVGVAVYFVERTSILAQIDGRLRANLDSARFLVQQGDPDTGAWTSSTAALTAVVQRMSPDDNTGVLGIVAGAPALLPGVALDVDLQSAPGFAEHVTAQTADGDPMIGTYAGDDVGWRYLAAPITIPGSPEPTAVLFAMAYDVNAELAEINDAAGVFLVAGAIVVVVIGGVAWVVATRLLRPIRQMRETAERVSALSLSERLPVEGRDDVSELAATMNDMLDRIDGALDSQRRLLEDVGHELKTPITIVRGYVEVMDPADAADVRETQALAVDELDRMGRLVQDLANAAALHGPAPVTLHPVDAADLIRQILRKAEGIAGARIQQGTIADVVVELDPGRITQAMLQLTQNAVSHARGPIVIGSRRAEAGLELWVRDHGDGVPDDAKLSIFERFQRGAGSESAGSGLGLNIVQVIARAHDGSVRVIDATGGGAVFVITIPIAANATTPLLGRPEPRNFASTTERV